MLFHVDPKPFASLPKFLSITQWILTLLLFHVNPKPLASDSKTNSSLISFRTQRKSANFTLTVHTKYCTKLLWSYLAILEHFQSHEFHHNMHYHHDETQFLETRRSPNTQVQHKTCITHTFRIANITHNVMGATKP